MRFNILLTTLTTAIAFQAQAANYCPDGNYMPHEIPNRLNPWIVQMGEFFGNLLCPYDGCYRQFMVLGGSGNYSTSSYPQYALYDLLEAVPLDADDFGYLSPDFSVNSEQFKNYFWSVYGGYHCGLNANWDIGVEIGYKKLIRTNSEVNSLITTVVRTLYTPFRNTRTYAWDLMATIRYTSYSGFNVFVKAGGAKLNTRIQEGLFINPADPVYNNENAFGVFTYGLTNIYPEVEIGAGFRFLNHFDVHVSYAKIFGEYENDLISSTSIILRPRKCPSIDIFSVNLELLLF